MKKLIAIDLLPMERRAREVHNFDHLPIPELCAICGSGDVDIIETLVTLPERLPLNDSPEEVARVHQNYINKKYALQKNGARVIECPTKRSQSTGTGFKQSDDQHLMLRTLILAMKLRPDFVILFAADGDFAPMVAMLREEGIRTEVVAPLDMLASDLQRHAVNVVDFDQMMRSIHR